MKNATHTTRYFRPTWTPANQRAALRDGWGIFNSGDDKHPVTEIQRYDEADIFPNDYVAGSHVRAYAQRDALAGKTSIYTLAVEFVATHAPRLAV